jgi:hypothetical protein
MVTRFFLLLLLLSLAQCAPMNGTRHVSEPSPSTPVEARQQIFLPITEEQIELFNYALDQA